MAATDQQVRRVVETYAEQHASLVTSLIRILVGLWVPFRWFGRPDMINARAAQSAVYVDVATEQARLLARAYMVQMLNAIDVEPSPSAFENMYARSGTPIVEVYKRPARQVEHELRKALESTDATKTITERIEQIVEADLAAAARDEQQRVIDATPAEKVIGYRRVIHPELSKTGTCGLCIVASSRFYTRDDLLDLHDRCKCTVAPLTASNDPGLRLNREDLDKLYEAAGSNYAEDLKRISIRTVEHGELGPILVQKGHHYKDVAEVNRQSSRRVFTGYSKPTKASNAINWAQMRDTSERSIEILEDARRRGTNLIDLTGSGRETPVRDIDEAIQFHRNLIARASRY
ncbi:hypothetical protein [Microbacterium sp. No. 7]|uniref:hypothetical protein n=1 Tax=Microbacterium sp. No. 7 TaxID=1714373 RepID=UPI0006D00C4F|nr:hypothetical protein [Microbacterium sp. No. 7]